MILFDFNMQSLELENKKLWKEKCFLPIWMKLF